MMRFLSYLEEAFPPPKKKSFGAKPGGGGPKPPFGGGGGKPAFGRKPVIKDDDESVGVDNEKTDEFDDKEGMDNGADALVAMQQAQAEKEEREKVVAQQKQAEEDAERKKVKALRAKADAEVMGALEDKFNPDDDAIEFYPELLTFGQFTDKSGRQDAGDKGQQAGIAGQQPGDGAPENAGSDGKKKLPKDDADSDGDDDDVSDDESDVETKDKKKKPVKAESTKKPKPKQQKKW